MRDWRDPLDYEQVEPVADALDLNALPDPLDHARRAVEPPCSTAIDVERPQNFGAAQTPRDDVARSQWQ